jgi:hypothetical protein
LRCCAGKMLGSHMAEAVGSLVSSSHPNRTAAQMAQLLNSKEAVAQAATAATEATLQAAVAVAPASVKPLKFPGGLTATAAASLDGASTAVQSQQQTLQQQSSRASHSAASRALTPKSNRSSRSGSLSPTLRPKQHAQPEQQQQQQQQTQAGQGPGEGFFLSTSCPAGSPRCSSAAAPAEGSSRRSTGTLGTYASLTVITGAERAASSQGNAASPCAAGSSPGSRQGSAAGTRSPSALASVFRPSLSPAVDGPLQQQPQQQQPGAEQQQQQQQQGSSADGRRANSSPGRSSRLQTGSSRCSSPAPALAPGTPQGHAAAAGSPHVSSSSRDGSPGAVRNSSSVGGSAAQQPPGSARQAHTPGSPQEAGVTSLPGILLPSSSRLSSATGQSSPAAARVQDQQLQLVEEQQEDLSPQTATGSSSSGCGADQQGGQLSSLYGLSLSAAICMADLVRQVRRPSFYCLHAAPCLITY